MRRSAQLNREAIERLTTDSAPYLSCDECFEQVDVAIEGLFGSGFPLAEPFKAHLLSCPVCHEEACSLAALVGGDFGLSPDDAITRLDGAVAIRSRQMGPRQ